MGIAYFIPGKGLIDTALGVVEFNLTLLKKGLIKPSAREAVITNTKQTLQKLKSDFATGRQQVIDQIQINSQKGLAVAHDMAKRATSFSEIVDGEKSPTEKKRIRDDARRLRENLHTLPQRLTEEENKILALMESYFKPTSEKIERLIKVLSTLSHSK